MTAAIFGLLGVIVGGVLNGLVSWRIERSRALREARAVARLTYVELGDARAGLNSYVANVRHGMTLAKAEAELTDTLRDDAWNEHGRILALVLEPSAWEPLVHAYNTITGLKRRGEHRREPVLLARTQAESVSFAAFFRVGIVQAMIELARYTGDAVPEWLIRETDERFVDG